MHTKLTLQEKLEDLRKERNLKLSDVEQATGISASTLSRFQTDEYMSIAYQDLLKLANLYDVSMDYLTGLTNHRKCRNVAIDELELTDEVVELLKSKRANNRLISELLAQEDFIALLATIEIYIDGKVSAGSNALNASISLIEKAIQKEVDLKDKTELLSTLKEAFVDENACLRYRITEGFHKVLLSLFDRHQSETTCETEALIVDKVEECLDEYFETKNEEKTTSYLKISAKQCGIDLTEFSQAEQEVLEKWLRKTKMTTFSNSFNNRSLQHYNKRKPSKSKGKK